MNPKEIKNILDGYAISNIAECPLCETKLEIHIIGDRPFLCCPYFDTTRFVTKVGVQSINYRVGDVMPKTMKLNKMCHLVLVIYSFS